MSINSSPHLDFSLFSTKSMSKILLSSGLGPGSEEVA